MEKRWLYVVHLTPRLLSSKRGSNIIFSTPVALSTQTYICRVIVDSGSCNNIASTEMVEKLPIANKTSPTPISHAMAE